ncbi:hypothetical protein VSR76_26875 [Klebsiella pneumoniae]|nr:hypothetical protein [Klebsiella pneumoniae]
MADINAVAKTAHKLLSDAEYSGCVSPHTLAAINMMADTAAEEAIAILEADIKNAPGDNEHEERAGTQINPEHPPVRRTDSLTA